MPTITSSDWKAWIDEMPGPGEKPMMHVIGTVDTHNKDLAFLRKKIPQGMNPKILSLDLWTATGTVPVSQPQKVHYTETLIKNSNYTSVQIFFDGKQIAEIKDVPVIK